MKVVFVGAGPGDPELITLKGKKEIESADVIIYAGSLINEGVLRFAKRDAILIDSHGKSREEIFEVYEKAAEEGKKVVRLHSGDISFYSAIQEQIEFLKAKGIEFEIVPGVSSLSAASAALKREFTSPNVSQTLIITKPFGRTGKPEGESIRELSKHGATMAIFLGVHLIEDIVAELRAGYPPETPIAVVYKASWDEEKVIEGTLEDIVGKVKEADIKRHSLIIVGDVLKKSGLSKLYSRDEGEMEGNKAKIRIFFIAEKAATLAKKVKDALPEGDAEVVCLEKLPCEADRKVKSIYKEIRESFREKKNIIAILPLGIVVRAIEPKKKTEDPWVVCIDERGEYVIPVLNGHRGANDIAKLIAKEISAKVVITTSS
ncbi:MAG: precorrin-4 C(11)-methyltransferase [Candidatus Methanospirareceae archaeon]